MVRLFDALEYMLDAVIPLRARAARTKNRTLDDIPLCPTEHDLLGGHITTIMDYRESAVQDLIRALKYDGSGHAAQIAGELLAEYLREEIASLKLFSTRKILIVPLPLHQSRLRERGFNQIGIVLDHLPSEFKDGTIATLAPHALTRVRATEQQTHLSRAERIKNVAGAFAVPDTNLDGTHVFLIDDVATTGATLVNAAKPLEKAGAEVTLLALARA